MYDSHARDKYGRGHLSGTCVLLEVTSIQGLVQYFQTIHSLGDNYELRGVYKGFKKVQASGVIIVLM